MDEGYKGQTASVRPISRLNTRLCQSGGLTGRFSCNYDWPFTCQPRLCNADERHDDVFRSDWLHAVALEADWTCIVLGGREKVFVGTRLEMTLYL